MKERAAVLVALLALTAVQFLYFPGHTILQSDTQIYLPILERLWDPSLLARDLVATRPHVTFTIYDEAAVAIRRLTTLPFESVLMLQQVVYRFAGIAGLFLIGRAVAFDRTTSVVLAAVLSLGATISGPAVLTVEYEPVPRGFALPLIVLSMGLAARGRWSMGAAAAGLGFLFHPPTAVLYLWLFACFAAWDRRWRPVSIVALAVGIMGLFVALQADGPEKPALVTQIAPWLEELQRMRASYNWVSIWFANWVGHYLLLWTIAMLALWRVWVRLPSFLRLLSLALPAAGLASVPLSYLLLEKAKLAILPQFQPGRYVLFITFMAVLLATVAAIHAAEAKRWAESLVFFVIGTAIPMGGKLLDVLFPVAGGLQWTRLALAVICAVLLVMAVALRGRRFAIPLTAAVVLLPFVLIPDVGKVSNYAKLHTPSLDAFAAWAAEATAKDAVFQFADAGRALSPGVFRARAKRALYADWKSGGQVNFMEGFAAMWWDRWQKLERMHPLATYAEMGIDYVVLKQPGRMAADPVYQNDDWVVYRAR